MNKLNVILNGNIVEGFANETVLQLAKRHGIDIPTLCNDDRLEPFSSCYVCVVEIEGMRGLQPSCSTKIAEGMKIHTDNEKIYKSRKMAIELLLSNHYADCVAPCKLTCPAGVDVQGYISLIDKGLYNEAVALIKKTNPLPAICGRVCVRPCEVACRRNLIEGVGVGIDYLKRYTSDIDLKSDSKFKPEIKAATGKKIAIIGAGPAGLTSAYYLRLEGHTVDIYEASPNPGGMLRYGIPPYRLPNDIIDAEVKNITDLGVNIFYNKKLGDNVSYKDLKNKYDSFIITVGSQIGSGIGCENDDAGNIFSGIDFLRNMEMTGKKLDFKAKKVAVIGGGNTAMDCCRSARRCGAEEVLIIYRRTEKEMPANPIEIHESKLESVKYMFLTAPASVIKDADGNLDKLICYKMELGEPDASGRRRPVKVEGSEFEIKLDYILAAIGQKTNVNFLDDINNNSEQAFILNKWGDINTDKNTLQTSIKNMFAAGDSVTGPATLIEAIAQGRKAARSAHQYLSNQPFTPEPYEFISKKDNFEVQKPDDYKNLFQNSSRQEMPTLDPDKRNNFDEVELGYHNNQASTETERCLECGCVEYYDCTLKKIASDYNADQKKFSGDYKKFNVDFSHPFIEIDNNKCILCARCVRICNEVVGANALGLINRGFETYVVPSLGNKLTDTQCESCGMCISTCPTAAISENYTFKPGPVKTEDITTVCNFCSIGCSLDLKMLKNFIFGTKGYKGLINEDGNLCKYGKFAYTYLNNKDRLKKPLLKENGKFVEISFEKAFDEIAHILKDNNNKHNAYFTGARLTNEEMFQISRLANIDKKDNILSSFHYLGRNDTAYAKSSIKPTALKEIENTKKIFLFASEINMENAVAGFMINNARKYNQAKLITIADDTPNKMLKKSDEVIKVKSYYHLVKALNHYLLSNKLQNNIFINDHCSDFEKYKEQLLNENYNDIVNQSGLTAPEIKKLADIFNDEAYAILMYAEKNISSHCALEIFNLGLITGKTGKTGSGIIPLKEKNNAQGLCDLSLGLSLNNSEDVLSNIETEPLNNMFIFGEDPIGCALDKNKIMNILAKASFVVVQDYFLTETAMQADLILPASLAFEIGGTYTNTHKYIQNIYKQVNSIEFNSLEQINEILKRIGIDSNTDTEAIFKEYIEKINKINGKLFFTATHNNDFIHLFMHGCDNINMWADNYFKEVLN